LLGNDSNDRHVIIGSLILAGLLPSPRRQRSIHAQQRGAGRLHSVNVGHLRLFSIHTDQSAPTDKLVGTGHRAQGKSMWIRPNTLRFEAPEGRSSVTDGKQVDGRDDDEGRV
jgi:hypothetical protein